MDVRDYDDENGAEIDQNEKKVEIEEINEEELVFAAVDFLADGPVSSPKPLSLSLSCLL